jgi:hypothetical protein
MLGRPASAGEEAVREADVRHVCAIRAVPAEAAGQDGGAGGAGL